MNTLVSGFNFLNRVDCFTGTLYQLCWEYLLKSETFKVKLTPINGSLTGLFKRLTLANLFSDFELIGIIAFL